MLEPGPFIVIISNATKVLFTGAVTILYESIQSISLTATNIFIVNYTVLICIFTQ